jgi:predicted nucleic acid-binding protein
MTNLIVLDSNPLGLITNPKVSPITLQCQQWFKNLSSRNYFPVLPEIIDYEVRRELIRADKQSGIKRLDQLKAEIIYLPITTPVMLKAAELWAQVRKQGKPTSDDKALDGDVILASQAILLSELGHEVIVATSNPKHISLFITAKNWNEI